MTSDNSGTGSRRVAFLAAGLLLLAGVSIASKFLGWFPFDIFPPVPSSVEADGFFIIALGVLTVAFFRLVVGIPTLDIFSPIMLAFVFSDLAGHSRGLEELFRSWFPLGPTYVLDQILFWTVVIFLCIFVGGALVINRILAKFRLLYAAHVSAVVVLLIFLVVSMISWGSVWAGPQGPWSKFGPFGGFAFIMIFYIVERAVLLDLEAGFKTAWRAFWGTVLTAVTIHYVLFLNGYHFLSSFPEVLWIVLALVLLLGRYRGLRLSERWRFRGISHR